MDPSRPATQHNVTEHEEDNALIDSIITCEDISQEINGLYDDNVLILGDSILKEVAHIRNAQVRAYRGDTLEDLKHHMEHDSKNENLLGGKRIIVIHAGTNDLYTLSVEDMISDLTDLTTTIIDQREMWIYCIAFSAILPRAKDYWTTLAKIRHFNAQVKANGELIGVQIFIRSWRPFSRKHLPRKFMYKIDGIHPSKKGSMRLSQYLAKQCALIRKEHKIPRNQRAASRTIVSKKPVGGYGYPGARVRNRILYRPHGTFPKEPTYGTTPKDIHRPRQSTIRRLKKNTTAAIKDMRTSIANINAPNKPPKIDTPNMATTQPQHVQKNHVVSTKVKRLKNGGLKKEFTLRMKMKMKRAVRKMEAQSNIQAEPIWEHGEPCIKDIRIMDNRGQATVGIPGRKYLNIYMSDQNQPPINQEAHRMREVNEARSFMEVQKHQREDSERIRLHYAKEKQQQQKQAQDMNRRHSMEYRPYRNPRYDNQQRGTWQQRGTYPRRQAQDNHVNHCPWERRAPQPIWEGSYEGRYRGNNNRGRSFEHYVHRR